MARHKPTNFNRPIIGKATHLKDDYSIIVETDRGDKFKFIWGRTPAALAFFEEIKGKYKAFYCGFNASGKRYAKAIRSPYRGASTIKKSTRIAEQSAEKREIEREREVTKGSTAQNKMQRNALNKPRGQRSPAKKKD